MFESCGQCPSAEVTSRRRRQRSRKCHQPVGDWFDAPLIRPEYLTALGQLFIALRGFESVRDLTEYREDGRLMHGFRTPADLTSHGAAVFEHTGIESDVLEAELFRFRVTDKARLWCLGDRETGEFEVLFWDPHHYLGTGSAYNTYPDGPEWDLAPFDDSID